MSTCRSSACELDVCHLIIVPGDKAMEFRKVVSLYQPLLVQITLLIFSES